MNKLRVLIEQPPPARGDAEQQVSELRTYISRMVEELQFLFEHMDARATDYDPFDSGLLARNTQDAIDELTAGVQNVPTPYPNNPAMDGTAYPGASNSYARGDHVHPRDINKQNKILASGILKGDGDGGVSAAAGGIDYADPEQLAYVETGATATKTGGYTAGVYICWQGKQYTADTNIAYGTSFYASGGSKNLTECLGGGFNSLHQKTKDFVKIATYTTGGNYPLAYSSYSEFILVFVLAGSVRLAEYVPASLFSVGSRWRITQDGNVYFDVMFNSGNTVNCKLIQGNYTGSFGEIWAR